jgi:hypothetical protein
MFASNAHLFRRADAAHDMMLRATMPKSGVVEFDNFLPRVPLTGRVWRSGNAVLLPKAQHKAVR